MHSFIVTTPEAWVLSKPGTLNFPQPSVMLDVTFTLGMVAHVCVSQHPGGQHRTATGLIYVSSGSRHSFHFTHGHGTWCHCSRASFIHGGTRCGVGNLI